MLERGPLRGKEALRDRLLPEGAVAAEEDADRGRPVEGARPPAGEEGRGAALVQDLPGHPKDASRDRALVLVARLLARALGEDADRDHVERHGEERAHRAARRA